MDKLFLSVKKHGSEKADFYIDIMKAIAFTVTDSGYALKIIFSGNDIVLPNIIPQHVSMTYAQLAEFLTKITVWADSATSFGTNEFNKNISRICKASNISENLFSYDDWVLKLNF